MENFGPWLKWKQMKAEVLSAGQENKQVLGRWDYKRQWANLVLRQLIEIFSDITFNHLR